MAKRKSDLTKNVIGLENDHSANCCSLRVAVYQNEQTTQWSKEKKNKAQEKTTIVRATRVLLKIR
jgi:hypothetical protein